MLQNAEHSSHCSEGVLISPQRELQKKMADGDQKCFALLQVFSWVFWIKNLN